MVLDGPARKISLVLLLFSILGWITYIIGFALRIYEFKRDDDESNVNPLHEDFIPFWCFAVGAPFLYIVYFIHLYVHITFTHYLSIFFTAIYFTAAGGVLYINGILISYAVKQRQAYQTLQDINVEYCVIVEFAGILFSCLFYWFSIMLWPCFRKNKAKGYYDY